MLIIKNIKMKKVLLYLPLMLIMFTFTSCKKQNAEKDLENAINKLNFFNQKFDEFYQDGVISKKAANDNESSEYDQLKRIATEYYELINKINKTVADIDAKLKDGEENKYRTAYVAATKKREAEIDKVFDEFKQNVEKIE